MTLNMNAAQQVYSALGASNITFPMITEICDRCANKPWESRCAVEVLFLSLKERTQTPPRVWLQSLTIMNEIVHVPSARQAFEELKQVRQVLLELQKIQNTGLGPGEENIRIFATELLKILPQDRFHSSFTSWPAFPSLSTFPWAQWDCFSTSQALGYQGPTNKKVKKVHKKRRNRLSSSASRSISPSPCRGTCSDGRKRWGILQRVDIVDEIRFSKHLSAGVVSSMRWGSPPTNVTLQQARELLAHVRKE